MSIDIGMIVNPIRHPDLIIQKLYHDEVTFWHAGKSMIQELSSGNALIVCDTDLMQTQWLLKRLNREGIKYQRLLTSSSLEVIANLTANGAGIGILPTRVALSAYPKILKPILNLPKYQDEICLVYRPEKRNVKAMQTIINSIKTTFKVSSK